MKKNLKAHYAINRLASIVFALSFSCVMLTTMSFNIASTQFNTSSKAYNSADIIVVREDPCTFNYKVTDSVLKTYSYKIKSFAYLPETLAKHQFHNMFPQQESKFYIEDAMKVNQVKALPIGVQPSQYFDGLFKKVRQGQKTATPSTGDVYVSGLNATEQLYTARGVQSMAVSEEAADTFALDPSSLDSFFMFVDDGDRDYSPIQLYTRTSYVVEDLLRTDFWWNVDEPQPNLLMQLPMFTMLANSTFDDLIMKALFIQVYADSDVEDFIDKFVAELEAKTWGHLDIYSRYTD